MTTPQPPIFETLAEMSDLLGSRDLIRVVRQPYPSGIHVSAWFLKEGLAVFGGRWDANPPIAQGVDGKAAATWSAPLDTLNDADFDPPGSTDEEIAIIVEAIPEGHRLSAVHVGEAREHRLDGEAIAPVTGVDAGDLVEQLLQLTRRIVARAPLRRLKVAATPDGPALDAAVASQTLDGMGLCQEMWLYTSPSPFRFAVRASLPEDGVIDLVDPEVAHRIWQEAGSPEDYYLWRDYRSWVMRKGEERFLRFNPDGSPRLLG